MCTSQSKLRFILQLRIVSAQERHNSTNSGKCGQPIEVILQFKIVSDQVEGGAIVSDQVEGGAIVSDQVEGGDIPWLGVIL